MRKIFITTNIASAKALYNNALDAKNAIIKAKLESDFARLPITYEHTTGHSIIVIGDDFNAWTNFSINKKTDYILYHKNSAKEIVDSIKLCFDNYKGSSHSQNGLHDQIYRIIFDDDQNDKSAKILQVLAFDPEEEKLTEAIFTAIYDKKPGQEIELAFKERDNYLESKHI